MNREKYISYINEKLSILIVQIENYGILNISILNILSEDFFCELFNILFDLNLKNVNFNCSNYASIDLEDGQK
ncbi:TPA: SMEK domain-containing protein, partial [Acinetobacter baumannii]